MKRLGLSVAVAALMHGALLVMPPPLVPRSAEKPVPPLPVMIDLGLKTGAAAGGGSITGGSLQTGSEPSSLGDDRVRDVPVRPILPEEPPQESAAELGDIASANNDSLEQPSAPAAAQRPDEASWVPATTEKHFAPEATIPSSVQRPPPKHAAKAQKSLEQRKAPIVRKRPKTQQAELKESVSPDRPTASDGAADHEVAGAPFSASLGARPGSASAAQGASGALQAATVGSGGHAIPSALDNPAPPYPEPARRRGQQGTVLIEALVDRTGSVSQLRLQRSSGSKSLDEAALEAVGRWRFRPGEENDRPISMWIRIPVRFVLE